MEKKNLTEISAWSTERPEANINLVRVKDVKGQCTKMIRDAMQCNSVSMQYNDKYAVQSYKIPTSMHILLLLFHHPFMKS